MRQEREREQQKTDKNKYEPEIGCWKSSEIEENCCHRRNTNKKLK